MISKIKNTTELQPYFVNELEEHTYRVNFDVQIDRDVNTIIIRIDNYYASLRMGNTPPSTDGLIVLKRNNNNNYNIYIVELKNIKDFSRITKDNIIGKFQTTIDDFMKVRYGCIFLDTSYIIDDIFLYFVTDPLRQTETGAGYDDMMAKYRGTFIDFLFTIPPFEFRGMYKRIEHHLPNPLIPYI